MNIAGPTSNSISFTQSICDGIQPEKNCSNDATAPMCKKIPFEWKAAKIAEKNKRPSVSQPNRIYLRIFFFHT